MKHSIKYFKDIIGNIDNIQLMEMKLNQLKLNFNIMIGIINQKIYTKKY